MPKNIWIINEHLTTPDLSENGHSRHHTLAQEFNQKGYDVTLITSSFSHNPKRKVPLWGLFRTINGTVRTFVIKGFSHKSSRSMVRVFNWTIFALIGFLVPFTRLPKPDIIILSSTPMLPIYNVLFYKWYYGKTRLIFETRDLWPLTPKHLGNYSDSSMYIRILAHLERKCYSKADYIVSVLKDSNKHIERILGHSDFNFRWISNGVDLNRFRKIQRPREWAFRNHNPNHFIIGYAGTLGIANAMEFIVDAFNEFFYASDTTLVVLGGGAEKEALILRANNNPNIIFLDTVDRRDLGSFYANCDALYLSWRDADLYKYGISANKIFEYMLAKKPILMSCNIPGNTIEESNSGLIARAEDSEDIAQKIGELKAMKEEERNRLGMNGYEYLKQNFTYDILTEKYVEVFDSLWDQAVDLKR